MEGRWRGGFVPNFLTPEPLFSHCCGVFQLFVFLSFKPRALLFRGTLPGSLVDKATWEAGPGLRVAGSGTSRNTSGGKAIALTGPRS